MRHHLGVNRTIVFISAQGPELSPRRHGAKARGLQDLLRAGFDVPPAFVIGVEAADRIASGDSLRELDDAVERLVHDVGEPRLAVRSGAVVSLPGAFRTLFDVHPDGVQEAVRTVVVSTRSPRASAIANALGLESVPPTAVIVQRQVDATADRYSGAGAATSRDLFSGDTGPVGSFAWRTRGDAIMAGTVPVESLVALGRRCPDVLDRLVADLRSLESDLDGPVEVEFAVESGRLWYLQVRRVRGSTRPDRGLRPEGSVVVGIGRAASPGMAAGELMTDIDEALDAIDIGRRVILALDTTSPSEVEAMTKAAGVITVVGSPECHAAVIARAAGVPAVVSVRGLTIATDHVMIGDVRVARGEVLIVDGTTGTIASATVTP